MIKHIIRRALIEIAPIEEKIEVHKVQDIETLILEIRCLGIKCARS